MVIDANAVVHPWTVAEQLFSLCIRDWKCGLILTGLLLPHTAHNACNVYFVAVCVSYIVYKSVFRQKRYAQPIHQSSSSFGRD